MLFFQIRIVLIVFAYLHIFAHKKRVSVRFAEIDIFNHILLQEKKKSILTKHSVCCIGIIQQQFLNEKTPEKIEKQCDQSLEQNPE